TLAHELAHVVQQKAGPVDRNAAAGGIEVSDPSDRFEREADTVADSVMRGNVQTAQSHLARRLPAPGHRIRRAEGFRNSCGQGSAIQRQPASSGPVPVPVLDEPAPKTPARSKEA